MLRRLHERGDPPRDGCRGGRTIVRPDRRVEGFDADHWRHELRAKIETISLPPEMVFARAAGAGRRWLANLADSGHWAIWAVQLRAWAEGFVRSRPTDTLSLLKDLSFGVSSWILYQSREDEGTQSPIETLDRGWGSCRDLAVLFIEAARTLGFGARVVSGYLYNPARAHEVGTTHAWAEIFVPGAGWITFDPTNRGVGGSNLIPVAVAHNIAQAMPVAGSFTGMTDAFQGMSVEVVVGRS